MDTHLAAHVCFWLASTWHAVLKQLLTSTNCCRDAHAFERKIKRANAKKNRDLAERLQAMRPSYRLDHLVKERCVHLETSDGLHMRLCSSH